MIDAAQFSVQSVVSNIIHKYRYTTTTLFYFCISVKAKERGYTMTG